MIADYSTLHDPPSGEERARSPCFDRVQEHVTALRHVISSQTLMLSQHFAARRRDGDAGFAEDVTGRSQLAAYIQPSAWPSCEDPIGPHFGLDLRVVCEPRSYQPIYQRCLVSEFGKNGHEITITALVWAPFYARTS